jgi:serine/threonine protein kinase
VSLAATLVPKASSNDTLDDPLEPFRFKDLGIINQDLILLGYGSSFMVSVFYNDENVGGLKQIVLKRTIPLAKKQNDAMFQNRIKAMMLELRTLAHDPVRKHENIVNLLGLAWETDPFNIERKWPVFLVERATRGTLLDLFQTGTPFSLPIRLNLILDIILGLEVLHLCGIIHGDVKLENVLVFDNSDNSIIGRPFIAKLADFGGSLFDVSTSSFLPSGTQPWNALEWRKQLDSESLKLTDIYSLGFVIWRIFTNGKHPFLARAQPASREIWLKEVEDLKTNDEDMQKYLIQISAFETEIERQLLKKIIMQTVRTAPAHRNVAEAKLLVQEAVQQPR